MFNLNLMELQLLLLLLRMITQLSSKVVNGLISLLVSTIFLNTSPPVFKLHTRWVLSQVKDQATLVSWMSMQHLLLNHCLEFFRENKEEEKFDKLSRINEQQQLKKDLLNIMKN